ncbi:MAG: hypothetical protein N2322_05105 [Terrimicrobiaceae bacterium]|nr:hypothetical protein [Terrimicrobiaceae bacterium]
MRLGHFFIRRALRLMPALALMLAVFVAAGWLFAPRWLAVSNSVDALIAFFNLSNWARAFGWRPHNMIGHTWSLGIEQQFYLVWAPLAALALRLRGARLLLLLAVIIGLGSWGWRVGGMLLSLIHI